MQNSHQQKEQLVIDQIEILYKNLRGSILGLLPLSLILLYLFSNAPIIELILWVIALSCSVFLEWSLIHHFNKVPHKPSSIHRWGWGISLTSFLIALCLSLAASRFIDLDDIKSTYLILALLIFPVFGSAHITAAFQPAHIGWVLATITPISTKLIIDGTQNQAIFGIALLISCIPVALYLGWNSHHELIKTLKLRQQNQQLLTELFHKKEKAEQSSKRKSHFLAAASHDLRQPLHAINLCLGALELQLTTDEQKSILNKTKNACTALTELLNSLFDISRIDSGEIKVHKQVFYLNNLLHDILIECTNEAHAKGLELTARFRNFLVVSDPILLTRIVRNLLNNAIKHTQQGRILLTCRKQGQKVHIAIWDTGPGIPENELENIFSEFYQLNNPQRDRNLGIGLGLAIVQRLAKLLNTEVQVQSQVNKGSVFSLNIELVDIKDSVKLTTSYDSNSLGLPDMSLVGYFVVLIDDDRSSLDGLRLLFKAWECETLALADGYTAITALQQYHYEIPNLIISDYRLPGIDGITSVTRIRKLFQQNIPALILSADSDKEIEQKAYAKNCDYLKKPVNLEQLKQTVRNCIDQ